MLKLSQAVRAPLGASALAGLWLLAAAATATARPSANGPWIAKDLGANRAAIAGHRTDRGAQSLAALIRDWGPPARLQLRRADCVATWSRPAARVRLTSLGAPAPGQTYCSPGYGLINDIRTLGSRWLTETGLRIGAQSGTVSSFYPDAWLESFPGLGRVWLLRPFSTIGISGPVTVSGIYASVGGGRVVSFRALVGAEGE